MLHNLLIIAAILVVMLYLVVPVMVYQKFFFPFRDVPRVASPGSLPDEAWRYLDRVAGSLRDEGFVRSAPFIPPAVLGSLAVAMLLVNRRTGDLALVTSVFAAQRHTMRLKVQYVEFMSLFEDGSGVQTNNSSVLSSFPPTPGRQVESLPEVVSPSRLYKVHQARLVAARLQDRPRIVPEPGEEMRFAVQQIVDSVSRQVETGYIEERGGGYRATLYGAFAMVWKELPPLKQVRWMLHRRRAARLLGELKLDE
jgi:hypothetical protein